MRLAPLLALPPIALGIAAAVWMISSAPGPVQVEVGPPGQSVRVLTVVPEDLRPVTSAWGNLRAAETWVAVAEVQGEVVFRHPDLEPGRLVPAGTEVLRIDPADYELALAQAEADLDGLAAEQDQVKAEAANTARILELERERLALAEADLERTLTLAKQGTVPQARLHARHFWHAAPWRNWKTHWPWSLSVRRAPQRNSPRRKPAGTGPKGHWRAPC